MWCICEFEEDNTTEAIPNTWLFDNGKRTRWPLYKSNNRIVQAITKKEQPEANWRTFSITRQFCTAGEVFMCFKKSWRNIALFIHKVFRKNSKK